MSTFENTKVMLVAKYMGSDFNYANSRPFRKKFARNTVDKEILDIGFMADHNFLKRANPNGPG